MSGRAQRPQTPEQHREAQRPRPATCVYCGSPLTPEQAKRWPGTCGSHSDLPARDPNYMAGIGRRKP